MICNEYTKYIGWMLSDAAPQVRINALKVFSNLYKLQEHVEKFDLFVERFSSRIVQMTQDVDDGVSAATIPVLIQLLQEDMLDQEAVIRYF